MDTDSLKGYIVNRLSEIPPFDPPLFEMDESPREFIENAIYYARKANRELLSRIEGIVKSILWSFFDWQIKGKSEENLKREIALLSHSVYLAGTFRIEFCRGEIWGLCMNGIGSGIDGPLGPVNTLVTEAAGLLGEPAKVEPVAFWKTMFDVERDIRKSVTAFANLYHIDPLSATEPAKDLLSKWSFDKVPDPLDIPEVVTRYFLRILEIPKGGRDFSRLQDVINDVVTWAQSVLPEPKLKVLFEAMKKQDGTRAFVPASEPVTLCGFTHRGRIVNLRNTLSNIVEKQNYSLGFVKKDLDESHFANLQTGIIICVIDDLSLSKGSNGTIEQLCSIIYRVINRAIPFVSFLISPSTLNHLKIVIEKNTRLRSTKLHLTSLATERLTCFESYKVLPAMISKVIPCTKLIKSCFYSNNEPAEKTRSVVRKAAIWRGDILYNMVKDLFVSFRLQDFPNIERDCFLSTLHSLSEIQRSIHVEPAEGAFGVHLSDVIVRPCNHVFNIEI